MKISAFMLLGRQTRTSIHEAFMGLRHLLSMGGRIHSKENSCVGQKRIGMVEHYDRLLLHGVLFFEKRDRRFVQRYKFMRG